LLNQVPAVSQLSLLNGNGREQLRLSRTTILVAGGTDFSRDIRFTETVAKGVSYAPAYFREQRPLMSIAVSHSGFNAGVTVAEIDLRFLIDFLGEAQVGKAAFAYVVDPRGQVLASSAKGPEVARDLSKLPQVAALIAPDGHALASGTDADGHAVLTVSNAMPKLGWFVLFEQPTAQALAPIRDQLVRIALLIGLGLAVAILAGTLLARRMLIPITALARVRGVSGPAISAIASMCEPKMSWKSSPISSTAWPASCMRPIRASNPRWKSARAIWRGRSTNSRFSKKSGARSLPRSISTPCCPQSQPARSKSPMPMRC
jgi:hypothetical protein